MDRMSNRLINASSVVRASWYGRMGVALVIAAAATAACGTKGPTDATTPKTATSSVLSTPDKAGDSATPQGAADAPATASSTAAAKPAAPASDEPQVSDMDPGDSGAFNLGAQHTKPVIDANRPFLNRSCWANAVKDTPNGPAKIKLVIELEIQPDGKVTKATLVGGKDYPGFAPCVEKHVRRWHFPKAKAVSSAMFPLEFTHGDVEWKVKEKK
jgi:hypothetical protein